MQLRWDIGRDFEPRCNEEGRPLGLAAFDDLDSRLTEAWAVSADGPGPALHAALCRAAGVQPNLYGVPKVLEGRFGYGRSGWYQIVKSGGWPKVMDLAAKVGLLVIGIPQRDWVVVCHPSQLHRIPELLEGPVPVGLKDAA